MFIYYFAHIPLPFAQLAGGFTNHPDLWLPRYVGEAYTEGRSLAAPVGEGPRLRVAVGPIGRGEGSATFPFRIDAGPDGGLFTHLEADLEISELGPDQAQLTLRGSYRAPGWSTDAHLGPGLRHRSVEAITKGIVERVAGRLAGTAVAGGSWGVHTVNGGVARAV